MRSEIFDEEMHYIHDINFKWNNNTVILNLDPIAEEVGTNLSPMSNFYKTYIEDDPYINHKLGWLRFGNMDSFVRILKHIDVMHTIGDLCIDGCEQDCIKITGFSSNRAYIFNKDEFKSKALAFILSNK